jgi:hypothetical protein
MSNRAYCEEPPLIINAFIVRNMYSNKSQAESEHSHNLILKFDSINERRVN